MQQHVNQSGIKRVITRCGCDWIIPLCFVYIFYIILHGHLSPGGGFQGGVIVAAAVLLLYLGYGYKTTAKAINGEVLRINEAIGAILYTVLAACGLFLGVRFCQNVFFDNGAVGDMISAGTITFMSYSVGYKVLTGVGFLLLLMLGMLSPDDDEE